MTGTPTAQPIGAARVPFSASIEFGGKSVVVYQLGIAALDAGMQWLMQQNAAKLLSHERALCTQLIRGLQKKPGAVIYRDAEAQYTPVVSFSLAGELPDETAARLAEKGFCLRAGLQCAPLAHKTLDTENGTVRFSPAAMNTHEQVAALLRVL